MPSTRAAQEPLVDDYMESDEDSDPDYREDSADSDSDELPMTMGRDRAQWTVDNADALSDLYQDFLDRGRDVFGNAFFQLGSVTAFAHFVYKHTTPGVV